MVNVCKLLTGESSVEEITDEFRDEINRKMHEEFNNILNLKPTPKELEIKEILEDEKRKYELDKAEFESNPLHWSNNKRRRYGLPVLRGTCNKSRQTKFRSFRPTPKVFFIIADAVDEIIGDSIKDDSFFDQFVECK